MTDPTPDVPALRRLLAEAENTGSRTLYAEITDRLMDALPGILDRLEAAEGAVARVEALFNGGPDTPCRTTYRKDWTLAPITECVEVPMDDLRAALAEVTP